MENDKVPQGGWIVFGIWPFVLNIAQMHPFLDYKHWRLRIVVALLGNASGQL